jgi:hypothetical protein
MRERKSHIVPLAYLMLALFVSPLTVKAVHHHFPSPIYSLNETQGKSVSSAVSSCPVCHFEFVTFLAFYIPRYTYFSQLTSVDCCEPIRAIKIKTLASYSLRAPPAY